MKEKYLTVRQLDDGTQLPIPLCCGIVKQTGQVIIPEQQRTE